MGEELDKSQSIDSWQDLRVWQIAHNLVLKIYQVTGEFPRQERFRLVDQMCRAAASIPTNIAEGKGRVSTREYLHFLSISRGSIEETKYLLLLARDLGYLPETVYSQILNEYNQVGKMLNRLINALRQKV